MKKLGKAIAMSAVLLSGIASTQTLHAGIFDSIKTIVGGHVNDIQSRYADNIFIGTTDHVFREGQIRENDPGQDAIHNASGTVQVRIVDGVAYVQLDADFTSTLGPDYHVYVSTVSYIPHEEAFNRYKQVELGPLVKGSGASYYKIEGINHFDVNSVTIWCKTFGEFIGSASIH